MHQTRVLIVDDEPQTTRLMKLLLERTCGYSVRAENDSRLAMEAAESFHPDIVLLDVVMPEPDGGQVASMMRNAEPLKKVPIIFISGVVSEMPVRNSTEGTSRGYGFLSKPVGIERLIKSIKEMLGE